MQRQKEWAALVETQRGLRGGDRSLQPEKCGGPKPISGGYHSWSGGIPPNQQKRTAYAQEEPHGYDFVPFSVETNCRLGQPTMKLLHSL
jgi:hypothetical protein